MKNTVYHYCSSDTFLKIMNNCTLRATNIRKSNDYTEIINCTDIYKESIFKACEKYLKSNPNDSAFRKFYYLSEDKSIDIDEIIEQCIDNESCTYFVVCFSEEEDLLSQWRGYADDASGVAIGFNKRYLKTLENYNKIRFSKVNYYINNKDELVNYIIEKFDSVSKDENVKASDYYNAMFLVLSEMVYNAVLYKNPAFAEENEWRLVYYPFGSIRNLQIPHKSRDMSRNQLYYDRMKDVFQNEQNFGDFKRSRLNFEVRKNLIVSYVEFSFSNIAPCLIEHIVLGPKNNMDDLDLRLFLASKGFDLNYTRITKSKATYR